MKKEGITVLALIITIVVALILISASIVGISNVVANSRITKFTEEILAVEDKLRLYYIENDIAYKEGTTIYSKDQILNMIDSNLREEFSLELVYNNDENSTGFFIIDNSFLGIDRQFQGNVYIAAIPSLNVYSKNGIFAKGKNYFSISTKINGGQALRQNSVDVNLSTSQVQIVENLKVTKATNEWTNKFKITIETVMNENEKLYVVFNQKEVLLKTNALSNNIIYFDTLLSSNQNSFVVDSNSQYSFASSDIEIFNNLEKSKKYLEIIKKDSASNNIAYVKVDLSNVDLESPKVEKEESTLENFDEKNNIITIKANDKDSGIKEIRYEYLKTKDRMDGNYGEISYFSKVNITSDYLKYNGKQCLRDEKGRFLIKVPKEVSKIKLVAIDNASNVSDTYEIDTVIQNEVFYSVSKIKDNTLKISFYGDNLVSGTMEYGTSENKIYGKIDFENKETITLNSVEYVDNLLYIKVTTNNSNKRVINLLIPFDQNEGVNTKDDSRYYNPYIPRGFKHTVGNIENGFVIQDVTSGKTKYNEFVWVPIDDDNVKFMKTDFGIGSIATFQNVYVDEKNAFEETNVLDSAIEESVKKYGGFYVSRYEISLDVLTSTPKSVKNAISWTGQKDDALKHANSMYENNDDCKSTLITAKAYDSLVNWIALNYDVTTKSANSSLGNFSSTKINTGSNEAYVMNNIYDLTGNVAEFTTETYKKNPVFRGGYYGSTSEYKVMSVRSCNSVESNALVGIRAILYIK